MQKILTFAFAILFAITATAQTVPDNLTKNQPPKKSFLRFEHEVRAEIFGIKQFEAKEFGHSNKTNSFGYSFALESKLKGTPFVFRLSEEVSVKKIVEKDWEKPGPIEESTEKVIEATFGIGVNVPIQLGARHGLCVQISKDMITVEKSEARFNTNWPKVSTFFYFEVIEDFMEVGIGNVYQFKLTHAFTPMLKIELNLKTQK